MIQTHSKAKQGGFTLVEIAIVLVIIGLLLGGILKGQELITSARVRNMADQNSSVQAAYYGFLDRYRAIPGDVPPGNVNPTDACNLLGNFDNCNAAGGNGNGLIQDGAGVTVEAAAVWAQLAASGFLNGSYAGVGAYSAPLVAPANVYGAPILLAHTPDYQSAPAATQRLNLTTGAQVPVKVYQELDTKLDDGRPLSGVFRAASPAPAIYNPIAQGPAPGPAGCNLAGANQWNIPADQQNCNAVFLY